jgi:hypothetical protein
VSGERPFVDGIQLITKPKSNMKEGSDDYVGKIADKEENHYRDRQ